MNINTNASHTTGRTEPLNLTAHGIACSSPSQSCLQRCTIHGSKSNCTRSYVLLQGEIHAPDVVRPLEEPGFSPDANTRDKYAGEDCWGQACRT